MWLLRQSGIFSVFNLVMSLIISDSLFNRQKPSYRVPSTCDELIVGTNFTLKQTDSLYVIFITVANGVF